jgi:hypothetical protein
VAIRNKLWPVGGDPRRNLPHLCTTLVFFRGVDGRPLEFRYERKVTVDVEGGLGIIHLLITLRLAPFLSSFIPFCPSSVAWLPTRPESHAPHVIIGIRFRCKVCSLPDSPATGKEGSNFGAIITAQSERLVLLPATAISPLPTGKKKKLNPRIGCDSGEGGWPLAHPVVSQDR